eukprot:Skav222602  [mRNA]  locus=scaffold5038:84726:87845:+ [translate_table: standard]
MVRNDIREELFTCVFKPECYVEKVIPWHSPENQFVLPPTLAGQLVLNQELAEIYGDPRLLPASKRDNSISNQASVLSARISRDDAPLSTLVACYSKQHMLPQASLMSKGLFAELVISDGQICFQNPAMWTTLLGNLYSMMMPSQVDQIFEMLGNAISIPQALMACTAGLQAIGIISENINIERVVAEAWQDRLDATCAVCVQTEKGFAIFTPADFLLSCPVDRIRMLTHNPEHEGQCTIEWPDRVQTKAGFKLGAPLAELMKALGFPAHVMHLWGFLRDDDHARTCPSVIFHYMLLEDDNFSGKFVFLPMMPVHELDTSISEVSTTMEWTALPYGLSPAPSPEHSFHEASRRITCTFVMPDFSTCEITTDSENTIAQALIQHGFQRWCTHDTLVTSLNCCGELNMMMGPLHGTTVILSKAKTAAPCVLEITLLDGTTRFAPALPGNTIRETLSTLNFHPQLIERLHATHNGLLIPLDHRIDALGFPHIRLVAFPLKGGGKGGKSKGDAKGGGKPSVDPFLTNDPWASQPSSSSCRWDQLRLSAEHPVFDKANDQRIAQVPFMQVGPQKGGVAFATRSNIPMMAALKPPTPTVFLLPGFRGLHGVDIPSNVQQLPPQQVIVEEPTSGTRYKRLVIPLVLSGEIIFKVQESGAIPVASTKFVEMVLEASAALLSAQTTQQITDHPLECFKRLIAATGVPLQEVSIYSYRKLPGHDNVPVHQAMLKAPANKAKDLLRHSGKQEVFIRQYLQPNEEVNFSLLPRYWTLVGEEVRAAYDLGFSLGDSFRGLALSSRGVCIRACNESLAAARQLILQGDIRFNDTNRHVVCKHTYIAQGYPFAVSHECIIEATKKACQIPCVPLRSFRTGGLHTWVLGFAEHPKQLIFSVKVDELVYEVMLTEQPNIRMYKPPRKPNQPKGKQNRNQNSTSAAPPPVATQLNLPSQDSAYHALEARVNKLEVQQNALSDKVDGGFAQMGRQLQQVLEAVSGGGSGPSQPSKARGAQPSAFVMQLCRFPRIHWHPLQGWCLHLPKGGQSSLCSLHV